MKIPNTSKSGWPLRAQILVIMAVAVICVSFLAGETTRHFTSESLTKDLKDHNRRIVSVLSGAALEAVISEDIPLLSSIVEASVGREANIHSVRIENERSNPLVVWERRNPPALLELASYTEEVQFEGILYGRINIGWNVTTLYQRVDSYVLQVRVWLTIMLALLAIVVTTAIHRVTVRPLSLIHRRLSSLANGDMETVLNVSGSREIVSLAASVNALCNASLQKSEQDKVLAQVHRELFEAKERAETTLHSIGDGVITTDAEGIVDYLNPLAEELTGWSNTEAKGRLLPEVFQLVHESTRCLAENPLTSVLEEGRIASLHTHNILIARNNREFSIENSAAPIRAPDGAILGAVLVFRNVTKARKLAKKIEYQASHDDLTGLVNRSEFERRLQAALDAVSGGTGQQTLLYFDLDQFKVVNDTCGHAAGDRLLKQLSSVLLSILRQKDTLGRLGGDEFGVILSECNVNDAVEVAEELRGAVGNFRFSWQDKTFSIGVSIGVVEINDSFTKTDELLQAADEACYAVKEAGRNRVHVYQPDDDDLEKRRGEMQWVSRLHGALEENRFLLYAQLIQDISTTPESGAHYEILLRMLDENGELVAPGIFVPAAERYGVMPAIDRWVINAVLTTLSKQPEHVKRLSLCAINLSAATFADTGFLEYIENEIDASGIPPEKLCFEITETAAMSNYGQAIELIHALKKKGCLFALDDFGSGMSSFGYLKNMPVDLLKIEGAFVRDIDKDSTSYALVRSINEIGQVMGKRTIAEFVEDESVLACIREIGADYAQGYGLGKPVPIREMIASTLPEKKPYLKAI